MLKHLSDFQRTLEMPLINCVNNLILPYSSTCVAANSTGTRTFAIIDTKRYVPIVTLTTQDNVKILEQLKPDFKKKLFGINLNQKYQ